MCSTSVEGFRTKVLGSGVTYTLSVLQYNFPSKYNDSEGIVSILVSSLDWTVLQLLSNVDKQSFSIR